MFQALALRLGAPEAIEGLLVIFHALCPGSEPLRELGQAQHQGQQAPAQPRPQLWRPLMHRDSGQAVEVVYDRLRCGSVPCRQDASCPCTADSSRAQPDECSWSKQYMCSWQCCSQAMSIGETYLWQDSAASATPGGRQRAALGQQPLCLLLPRLWQHAPACVRDYTQGPPCLDRQVKHGLQTHQHSGLPAGSRWAWPEIKQTGPAWPAQQPISAGTVSHQHQPLEAGSKPSDQVPAACPYLQGATAVPGLPAQHPPKLCGGRNLPRYLRQRVLPGLRGLHAHAQG